MKQTIEIDVPDGYKAVWNNNKVEFVKIQPELPKTWEEFCRISPVKNGYYIGGNSSIRQYTYNPNPPMPTTIITPHIFRNSNTDKNLLSSKQDAEQQLVLMQLHQLRDYYRQGWVPDWKDTNVKYCIVWDKDDYRIALYTNLIRRFLSFPTRELAQQFLDNFRDLIEQVGDLI